MIVWLILVLSIAWYAVFRFRRRRMYQLAELIPGPNRELPLIGIAHTVTGDNQAFMKQLELYSAECTQKGGVMKIWMGPVPFFLITDALDAEFVLRNCLEKDDLHRFFWTATGNGSIYAPVAIWRRRRKLLIPTFYPKVLENFVDIFSEQSETLASNLQKYAGKGRFKIWSALSSCTLDSICETAMGVKINAQNDSESPFINAVGNMLRIIALRVFHLWLQPDFIYNLLPISKEFQNSKKVVCAFIDETIVKKREELESQDSSTSESEQHETHGTQIPKNSSLLALLITQSKSGQGLTNLELREEVITLSVAGSDTSAVAIGNTLKLLGKYPEIQDKVYEELCDVFGDIDRPLVKEDLPNLKYLERVIKESLRLFPPAPFLTRKVVDEVTLPSGRVLPAGVGALVSVWGVHRNTKYWGPDADNFDPDRFLPERFKTIPCGFIPFSFGPRNCIGYQYAIMSVKTQLSAIIRKYKIVDHPEEGPAPKMDTKLEIMMRPVDEYEIAFEERVRPTQT